MDTQPGQVNTPTSQDGGPAPSEQAAPSAVNVSAQTPEQPTAVPAPQPAPASVVSDADASPQALSDTNTPPSSEKEPEPGWQYTQEASAAGSAQSLPEDVSWTASEFVEHQKGAGWYGLLALAGLVLAVVDYFVTKDVVSTGVIVIAAVLFGIYAGHKPRTQQYHLSPQGLQIGEKMYTFGSFKAFSVAEEAGNASIMFTPLGRFAPALTIYVGSEMESQVLDYLSVFLPFEKRPADAVDGLLRRIRF